MIFLKIKIDFYYYQVIIVIVFLFILNSTKIKKNSLCLLFEFVQK